MNDRTENDKGFLKEKLGDYQVLPPEKVWESISAGLGGGRSRRNLVIFTLAAAASLALAVSLGIHFLGPDLPQESSMAGTTGEEAVTPLTDPSELETGISPAGEESMAGEEQKTRETLEEKVRESMAQEAREGMEPEEAVIALAPQDDMLTEGNEVAEVPADEAVTALEPEDEAVAALEPEDEAVTALEPEDEAVAALEPEDELPVEEFPDFLEHRIKNVRWMVGAAVSPLYSFRDAEASVMAGAGVHESGMLSYSSGIHVNYRRGSRLAFETGIFFNRTGLNIDASGIESFNQQGDFLVFGAGSERAEIKAVTNSVGNIISNSGEIYVNGYKMNAQSAPAATIEDAFNNLGSPSSGIEQHLDYLELPFNLRYTVVDRTVELQLVGGMSTNFLVNNYVSMQTSIGEQEIGYLSNIRTVNYSGNAGLGMIYHFGKNLNLMIEPRFRYFLNSINDSSLPATRPYTFGLYTSFNFTF
jgi:hypothetical protein